MKIETLAARFKGRCVYCSDEVIIRPGKPDPKAATCDHFIPLSKGGHRGASNQVLACHACNQAKGNLDPRMILFVWLWLDPSSFHEAILRFEKDRPNPMATVH
jgi:hypothetical protein